MDEYLKIWGIIGATFFILVGIYASVHFISAIRKEKKELKESMKDETITIQGSGEKMTLKQIEKQFSLEEE